MSATCDYISPARFEDVLDIAVSIDRLGTKSVTYAFGFSLHGVEIARGKVTAVCCRANVDQRLEAIPIPASIRARLQTDVASV